MGSCPEPLEKIFLKVEAETERRAAREQVAARQARTTNGVQDANEVPQPTRSIIPAPRVRRRGSISISRFGELAPGGVPDLALKGPLTPTLAAIPAGSLYQVRMTHSIDSFTSAHLGEEAKTEDDHQVTQVEHFPGRQTISKAVESLLPRRLSRARSTTIVAPLPDVTGLVIGVSVEEATVEVPEGHPPAPAVAFSPGSPRGKSFKDNFSDLVTTRSNWAGRAKSLSQKLRRKSTPVLKGITS